MLEMHGVISSAAAILKKRRIYEETIGAHFECYIRE